MRYILVICLILFVYKGILYGDKLIKPNSVAVDNKGNINILCGGFIYKHDIQGNNIKTINNITNSLFVDFNEGRLLINKSVGNNIAVQEVGDLDILKYAKYFNVPPNILSISKKIFYPKYIAIANGNMLYAIGHTAKNENGVGQIGIIDSQDGHTILAFGEFTREDTTYGLWNPWGIAADSKGNMYIANQGPYCVKKYDKDGGYITKWGKRGSGDGEFANAVSIAVDKRNDDVYVVDSYAAWDRISQERIQKFTKDGKFIRKWGEHFGLRWVPMGWVPVSYPVMTNISDLDTPAGIAVDNKGFVYVVERGKNRIHKYDENGNLILSFAGERGTGPGQFNLSGTINMPIGIAVDKDNNVYVCDEENNRVQKFDENGRYLMEIK